MGKVAVGTGPCFLSMTFQLWFQCNQCFFLFFFLQVPTQSCQRSSGVTSTPSLFSGFLNLRLRCFCGVCHVAFLKELLSSRMWPERRWHYGFPRSPALPLELLLSSQLSTGSWCTRSVGSRWAITGSVGFPLSSWCLLLGDHVLFLVSCVLCLSFAHACGVFWCIDISYVENQWECLPVKGWTVKARGQCEATRLSSEFARQFWWSGRIGWKIDNTCTVIT